MRQRLALGLLLLLLCWGAPLAAQEHDHDHDHEHEQHSFLQQYFLDSFWEQPFMRASAPGQICQASLGVLAAAGLVLAVRRRFA